MSEVTIPTVALDELDAEELAEICQFVADWLWVVPEEVAASFEAFVGSPHYPLRELRHDLASWAERLLALRPLP